MVNHTRRVSGAFGRDHKRIEQRNSRVNSRIVKGNKESRSVVEQEFVKKTQTLSELTNQIASPIKPVGYDHKRWVLERDKLKLELIKIKERLRFL